MSEKRFRRKFTDEFNKQVVDLFNAGKSRSKIVREYDLMSSVFNRWGKEFNTTGSFKARDNRTEEEMNLKIK